MRSIDKKKHFVEAFFDGLGPWPLIFAKPHVAFDRNYEKHDLIAQHEDTSFLIEDNTLSVMSTFDRQDDGIPTLRADLGTTLIPSAFGLELFIGKNSHPSLKEHFSARELLAIIDTWNPNLLDAAGRPSDRHL